MFGRQERLALFLLAIVACTVIASYLVLDHLGKRPFAAPYSDDSDDGDLVIVSGSVDRISLTQNGGHLLIELDNHPIFIPNQIAAGLSLSKGTKVTVIGTVQTFRGKKEITVQSASDITINEETGNTESFRL
jgi:hypothetical protein